MQHGSDFMTRSVQSARQTQQCSSVLA